MRRIIALMLAVLLVLGMTGCGGSTNYSSEPEKKEEEGFDAKKQAKLEFTGSFYSWCKNKGHTYMGTNFVEVKVSGNTYTVTGKVKYADSFHDQYKGNATGKYELNGEKFTQISFNVDSIEKTFSA